MNPNKALWGKGNFTGKATDLHNELDALFNSQNKSVNKNSTSIPATFLKVTILL